jgi:23S rRNA pseudouridine1911/1915/1917 synthase
LDQETSGVLLFARSKMSEERFNVLFEKHDLEREYRAIVSGHLPERQGTWVHFLREKENYDVEVTTEAQGRKAITHYEVLRYSKKLTYLRLRLETGRKHQIRIQCAQAGHPIVGDKRYGSLLNPFKRLCLQAFSLSFIHPFTQKKMSFSSPSPLFPLHFPTP